MSYDHKQALEDLIGQVRAMKERADEYFKQTDAEAPGGAEAEKHLRTFCVLKELERIGRAFAARADSETPNDKTEGTRQ